MKLTEKETLARTKLCLPLDGLETLEALENRVIELGPLVGLFKIGMESYTLFGQSSIEIVKKRGAQVFLDLKYHDIPETVKGAARAAARHGVYMFNVHAAGGTEMLKYAVDGARAGAATYGMPVPKILGVTVLTSLDEKSMNEQLRVPGKVPEQVLHLAQLADQAGLDGIVCSAADLYAVKDKMRPDFMYVTPGIKGPNTPAGKDQKRVFTPGNAIHDGSTILVAGRAITDQPTPELRLQAGYEILQDMARYQ